MALRPTGPRLAAALLLGSGCGATTHPVAEAAWSEPARVTLSVSATGLCVVIDGEASCWSPSEGAAPPQWPATPTPLPGGPFGAVASDEGSTCACASSGEVRCWSSYNSRCVTPAASWHEAAVIDAPPCVAISPGMWFCEIDTERRVWCWPSIPPSHTPTQGPEGGWLEGGVADPGAPRPTQDGTCTSGQRLFESRPAAGAIQLESSGRHYCVLIAPSARHGTIVRCWGANHRGATSDGPLEDGVVTVPLEGAVRIAAGPAGSCAITGEGEVYCWGEYASIPTQADLGACQRALTGMPIDQMWLQIGLAPDVCRQPTPRRIDGVERARQIVVGGREVCAIDGSDDLICWGVQTHDPSHVHSMIPVQPTVRAQHVRQVDLDGEQGCLLHHDGAIWCWGRAVSRLPRGDGTDRDPEILLAPGRRVARIRDRQIVMCDESAETDPCGPTE